jgi:ribosomal protein S10
MKFVFQIKLNAINKESLLIYKEFLLKVFNKLDIKYNLINLPIKKKRITLLKSPHVHKSSREQFEIKKNKILINVSSNIKPIFLKFLLLNKPKTVKIKINKL